MSREHLYKAKRVNWREIPKEEWWVEGDLVHEPYGTVIQYYEDETKGKGNCAKSSKKKRIKVVVEPETVCEYTGLNDKNSRKIFENDIVGIYKYNIEWRYGVVKYGEFNCSCCSGVYGWYFDDEDIRDFDLYEVRGNIFDNPELLKGGEVE